MNFGDSFLFVCFKKDKNAFYYLLLELPLTICSTYKYTRQMKNNSKHIFEGTL